MIETAKRLVKKYKSITFSQIKQEWEKELKEFPHEEIMGGWVLERITNFSTCACMLCKSAEQNCDNCIHKYNPKHEDYPCITITYIKISRSSSPSELYEAIQERIKYIEELIKAAESK